MVEEIYRRLARHLDNLPGGFPPSGSGVELRILKRLFTPEEAELAPCLTLIPEEPKVVARRAKIPVRDAARRLEEMSRKGLVFRMESAKGQAQYMASQFVIGIWEYHVNDLDEGLIRDMEEYGPTLFKESWKKPQLRTIPVNKSLTSELSVMSYENAEELVRKVKKAVVAPCICRREYALMGKGCGKPEGTCLVFGTAAAFYQRNGLGRAIDRQEVLDILKRADEAGLVLQSTNAKKIVNICCCCGDCCGVLRFIKSCPKPAQIVSSAFSAVADAEACQGCGACVERCQMEAVQLVDQKAVVDAGRCIGCGLCVSTCPTDAMRLFRKPDSEQPQIPRNVVEGAIELGRTRGKLSLSDLSMMQVKSKFDRLLASKKVPTPEDKD